MKSFINRAVYYSLVSVLFFVGYYSILTMYFVVFSASSILGIICAVITEAICLFGIVIIGLLLRSINFTKSKIKKDGTY